MLPQRTYIAFFGVALLLLSFYSHASPGNRKIAISNAGISMILEYGDHASITSMTIDGKKVISHTEGIFTAVKSQGVTFSSLHLNQAPLLVKTNNGFILSGITYGTGTAPVTEKWTFRLSGKAIKWTIERNIPQAMQIDEAALPVFNFDDISTWEGAFQGYGGLAWFYLFNEKLSTYGTHTRSCSFWNSKNGVGLDIAVAAPGKNVAMTYSRLSNNQLACTINVTDKELLSKQDSGTNRRRFIRGSTEVWGPYQVKSGSSTETLTLSSFDFEEKYGRGKFKGVNGNQVSAVLNTIARIGVIDSLHFGGNSWHTPYGPICLHEQYIGQMGLAINDPAYLKGYQSCLDYYRDHAITSEGRVYPRWAYTNEDAAPGQYNKEGFYEAQWGVLMDSNPDLVSNIADLFDMNGDRLWVKSHQLSSEKALDWILKRDRNHNGLVEMMNDNHTEKKSSDWIDIIWASYENAFVNAKLYHALIKWAAIERILDNPAKAKYYEDHAAQLKTSFNKPTTQGGFWNAEKGYYSYWRDKDNSVHGSNGVTPVNFMAIAYGICDQDDRRKTILDQIETQMLQEKLFFWPLAMSSYAAGEGKEYQFPFPSYENGDLFLSWGSIGVKAYAAYNPEIALKYVKNVLEQYSKDGLAFQRYGRAKQDGLGDDILSGNSLAIVGLYQAIYGLNPLYNRFYLEPHITPALEGTEVKYNYRNKKLTVNLDHERYSVSDQHFTIVAPRNFGFSTTPDTLSYFFADNDQAALTASTKAALKLEFSQWSPETREFRQQLDRPADKPVVYTLKQLKPNQAYRLSINRKRVGILKSSSTGTVTFNAQPKSGTQLITLTPSID